MVVLKYISIHHKGTFRLGLNNRKITEKNMKEHTINQTHSRCIRHAVHAHMFTNASHLTLCKVEPME